MSDAIDFRSDFVARPTEEMIEAMVKASKLPSGFDLRENQIVSELEFLAAKIVGKEDALFVPTCMMANQIAIALRCVSGDRFITEKSAFYLYTGIQAEYDLGFLRIIPSFAPGYYNYGDCKDLGYPLEFKSEIQMTFDLGDTTHLGMSYNHISNASLGSKNPGANSYMVNFLKQF